jgi:hypothetical protein
MNSNEPRCCSKLHLSRPWGDLGVYLGGKFILPSAITICRSHGLSASIFARRAYFPVYIALSKMFPMKTIIRIFLLVLIPFLWSVLVAFA